MHAPLSCIPCLSWSRSLKRPGLFSAKIPLQFGGSGAMRSNAMRWKTVAIVGVGLIGGSIGLALRERKLADRVIGIGRRKGSLDQALAAGCVTEITTNLAEGVRSAELAIVCTPVESI